MRNEILDEYLKYIRNGSKSLKDIDDSRLRDELIKMIEDDIKNDRSTGHERKALKQYKGGN